MSTGVLTIALWPKSLAGFGLGPHSPLGWVSVMYWYILFACGYSMGHMSLEFDACIFG